MFRRTPIIFVAVIVLAVFSFFIKNSANPDLYPMRDLLPDVLQDDKNIPISDAKNRITKKTFGLFISPQNSPVSPEKFSGYHTGVDFEIFSGLGGGSSGGALARPEDSVEENEPVEVRAFCDGTLILKQYVTGYGGVAVQKCVINGQNATVVYGHLKLDSIVSTGTVLKRGDIIGILGKGYSQETDGERKHLHLGIYKGLDINLRGYVQKPSELSSWIEPIIK